MADIVLVHGIAQEQGSAANLETEWLPSLAGGLENTDHTMLADRLRREADSHPNAITVRMAFYGMQFLTPDHQGLSLERLNPEEQDIAEELALDLLVNAIHSPNPKDAGEAREPSPRSAATTLKDGSAGPQAGRSPPSTGSPGSPAADSA